MNFIKQIERIQKINRLIVMERTGSPEELALRLRISRRQLYNLLDFLKDNRAPIVYSRERKTFYYNKKGFSLDIIFSIHPLLNEDLQENSGGFSSKFIPCNYNSQTRNSFDYTIFFGPIKNV